MSRRYSTAQKHAVRASLLLTVLACSTVTALLMPKYAFFGAKLGGPVARPRSPRLSVRMQTFWENWGFQPSSTAKSTKTPSRPSSSSSSSSSQKKKAAGFISPLPEGFPKASTLLRPEIELEGDHFLDSTRREFRKHRPSLLQALKFRIKPFGRLNSRTKVLEIKLEGSFPLVANPQLFSSPELTLPDVIGALTSASQDPRLKAVLIVIGNVEASTATVMEIRRAMDYFAQSGKPLWGFSSEGLTIDKLCLLGGCTHVTAVPGSYVIFTGFSFEVQFVRGVFDKIGIEPQVRRIGEFKSFGDTFARDSMSPAQREVTESLLSQVSTFKLSLLARDAGKTMEDVEALYNGDTPVNIKMLRDFGLVDELLYEDQMYEKLKDAISPKNKLKRQDKADAGAPRTQGQNSTTPPWMDLRNKKKKATADPKRMIVPVQTYIKRLKALPVEGIPGSKGDKTIAVILAEGGIVAGGGGSGPARNSGSLVVSQFQRSVMQVIRDSRVQGVVVRINSPGGDALASDLMWREVRRLREAGKIVVASVCNVAASGGYYIAMGCEAIVCDELSITGSIGVVQAKFALGELLDKIGLKVERLSKGKYAEILAFDRGFTREEDAFWSRVAMQGYKDFVEKAAVSRRMPVEEMQRRAQGRVWTGAQAKALGLVDYIGGLETAIEVCRDMVDESQLARKKLTKALKQESRGRKKVKTEDDDQGTTAGAEDEGEESVSDPIDVPVGPLGKPAEAYTPLEAQVVRETREEIATAKAKAKKPRLTRTKVVAPRSKGVWQALVSGEEVLQPDSFIRREPGGMGAASAEKTLIEVLGKLASPELARPMAIMDDTVGRLLPGVSGVPEDLRRLGVGPIMYTLLLKNPGLADALIEVVSRVGISALME